MHEVRQRNHEHLLGRPNIVSTHENISDFFTKPLSAKTFYPMRDAIMNVPHALREMPSAPAFGHGGVLKEARAKRAPRSEVRGG